MQYPFEYNFPLDDYYYVAQTFGYTPDCTSGSNNHWRKPDSSELRATVMLALAHGAKGIFFWPYYSYTFYDTDCKETVLTDAIVDTNNSPSDLYFEIKNNLFPRLNGTLGSTLLKLKYTGNYIYITSTTNENYVENSSNDYLAIPDSGTDYNWEAGFFTGKVNSDNKYFLLVNLKTGESRTANLNFNNTSGRANLRIRDVEDTTVDFTINTTYNYSPTLQAGEGELFQVVPVTKYGGKLKYDETLNGTNSLLGEMTIKSGAALTINGTYNIYKNITVNSGGSLNISSGAVLNFYNGASLTVNGTLSAQSTLPNKITFNFSSPNYSTQNGIKVNSGGTASISKSIIKNAYNGINIVPNSNQSTIEYSTIQNCRNGIYVEYGSTIFFLTISGNTIENNSYGIQVTNSLYGVYDEPIISNNNFSGNTNCAIQSNTKLTITNNDIHTSDYGIYLINTDGSYISGNTIHNNYYDGILLSGSGPYLFNNHIYSNGSYGIDAATFSAPQFGYYTHAGTGNNVLSNNYDEILAEYYSHPFFGTYDNANEYSLGGYNSIYGNYLDILIEANNNTIVDAEYTYWGSGPYNFFNDGTSTIDTNNSLSYDPNVPPNAPLSSGMITSANIVQSSDNSTGSVMTTSSENVQPLFTQSFDSTTKTWSKQHLLLYAGSTLRSQHHYKDAVKIYKEIISLNPAKKWAVYALKNLQEVYSEANKDTVSNEILSVNDLINYCKGIADSSCNQSLRTLSYLILGEKSVHGGKIKDAVAYYKLLGSLDASESKLLSSWELFNVYHSMFRDSGSAKKSFNYMQANFSDNHLTKVAASLLNPGSKIINPKKSAENLSKTADKEKETIPLKYNLYQNYPNPFNPSTTINYTLKNPSYVTLKVYNSLGQEVSVLADGFQREGYHLVVFRSKHLSSGIYFYRLSVKSSGGAELFNSVKKMLFLK